MAEKGIRNTRIAFGDFEIAISLKKAHHSRDPKLERVDADGNKITSSGGTRMRRGVDVDAGECYALRISEDQVVRLPQDELEEIAEKSKERYETMVVLETIDYRQVPTERILGSYWVQPRDGTARGLRLLYEGLRITGRVAVVKWVATSREKLGIIRPRTTELGHALLLSELAFANDFLAPDADALAIDQVELSDPRAAEAAARLVRAFARRGAQKTIDTASDEAVDARIELLKRVQDRAVARELEAAVDPLGRDEPSAVVQ
jgi:non-homologous end joining protein Ku